MIKRVDFFISDFSIPLFKLVYEISKHFTGLHVGMTIELIKIHLRQIGGGKQLGYLLFMKVTLVLAHKLMDR
jgi:hypothetical protein